MKTITLLSDFGADSPYVAAMKAVMLGIVPDVNFIDLTHSIPPQNIFIGAFQLAKLAPFFPDGTIHLAVVDPGVGTGRNLLATEFRTGENSNFRVVCPDNGLLSFLCREQEFRKSVRIENRDFWRKTVSNTFHGRDIMAPIAAHLASGTPLEELGPVIAESALEILQFPEVKVSEEYISCPVVHIDGFGNVITNLPFETVRENFHNPEKIKVRGTGINLTCKHVRTYGESVPGETVFLESSNGLLELALVNGNLAKRSGILEHSDLLLELE